MPQIVNIYEAKTHLSSLVDKAAKGELIVIARNNKPLAILRPYVEADDKGFIGVFKGKYEVPGDFDTAAQEEIMSMFEGTC